MHYFDHTIDNRIKFFYFIRSLLPPKSPILAKYWWGPLLVETLGLSMEFFKYGAVMPPKLGDVSKMTVEWLHNRCYMQKEASLSFYHVCCSTFQLFFSKKNIFSSYYNTIMIFFMWKFFGEIHFQNFDTNRSPCKLLLALSEWNRTYHENRRKRCETRSRIF